MSPTSLSRTEAPSNYWSTWESLRTISPLKIATQKYLPVKHRWKYSSVEEEMWSLTRKSLKGATRIKRGKGGW